MPYGTKQGLKAPGQYGIIDFIGLGFAGSAGIISALIADYQQQGEVSAIFTLNQWAVAASSMFGLGDVPLYAVILGLIGIGAGSVLYFQPITRQGAFAQGFGLLAVLMTLVPADLAGGLEPMNDQLPGLEPISTNRVESNLSNQGGIIPATYSPTSSTAQFAEAQVYDAQARSAARYEVTIVVNFPGGIPQDFSRLVRRGTIRGRLHNEDTNQTFNLFRSAGGTITRQGDKLYIRAGVPARSQSATLWVRIECAGKKIEQQSAIVTLGQPMTWDVEMQSSSVPLPLQRLRLSYWF